MSTNERKKRVFDKDLGVELVLDDEDETAKNDSNEQNDDRNRKRAKFEPSQSIQSSSNQRLVSASQPSRISNITNLTSYPRVEQAELPKESNLDDEVDDSENYDDIDYGDDDDDDDQDFNSDNHNEKQSQESKSKNTTMTYDDMDDLKGEGEEEDDDDELNDSYTEDHSEDEMWKKEQERHMREDEEFAGEWEMDEVDAKGQGQDFIRKMDDEKEKCAQEKCKYWPSCNLGNKCWYHHPTKPCRAFPNCRFGQKCLYIHPPCKFNPCRRPGCPFAHPTAISSTKHQTHSEVTQQPLAPRCKFGFKCMNLMCKFSHQRSEPCRFGANCLLDTCAYTHPSDMVKKKPANAFKWSAQP